MTSPVILTKAVIDDCDLYANTFFKRHRNESICTESHSDSNDEIAMAVDDHCREEHHLMKSLGLPTQFYSNRVLNKRSKKSTVKTKTTAKQKKSKDVIALTKKLSQLCRPESDDMVKNQVMTADDESSDDYGWFQTNLKGTQAVDWSALKREHLWIDLNDSDDEQQSSQDKTRPEDKDDEQTNTTDANNESFRSTSGAKRLIIKSFVNDGSDSDDDPPEERYTLIKRAHESDAMDLNEEPVAQKCAVNLEAFTVSEKGVNYKKPKSKYWHQRYRLFSRFDEGIRMDSESWYSVTPERIAEHIAQRFSLNNHNYIIIDAFCGSGGNTIQFALISDAVKVIAIDIDAVKIHNAKHNALIYGVDHRIEFICGDFMVLAKSGALFGDAVFLSPPWGGPKYLSLDVYTLGMMSPSGADVYNVTKDHISANIGILLPRNIDTKGVEQLAGVGNRVEIEDNLMNGKIKTKTAYFGDLIIDKS
ncbi:unnamed protein product [Oppiella nova]|uniref:Trimethylguanosine synthase n=1 Tax=Oppiella nova TaxID=334625 RepID=A0A7R9M4Z5_9ACAR|nr:unnamed protein product [Oppiella nova]CAG2169711.1 unnamed protein product [Oppiella nova]